MANEQLDYEIFFRELLFEVPEFEPFYQEHLEDNFGEIIPYLLMGDFTRFIFEAHRKSVSGEAGSEVWKNMVEMCLDLMERAINSPDERLEDLIWLGFVENLTPSYEQDVEAYKAIKTQLGPKLRKVLITYFDQDDWYENKVWS